MIQPPYFIIGTKIQNSLNDILGIFFGVYFVGINIPKESLPKLHFLYFTRKAGCWGRKRFGSVALAREPICWNF